MPRKNRKMENDRLDRINTPGSHGDMRAGDEGVDDPATSGSHRDDMSATPMHGDRMGAGRKNNERFDEASDFSGQGAQRGNSMDEAEGTGYTADQSSDESTTSRNRRENPLS